MGIVGRMQNLFPLSAAVTCVPILKRALEEKEYVSIRGA